MRVSRVLYIVALGILFSGCSALPQQWHFSAPGEVQASIAKTEHHLAMDLGWEDFFQSEPRLIVLIRSALTNNPDFRLAVLKIEETRASLGLTESFWYPTVTALLEKEKAGTIGKERDSQPLMKFSAIPNQPVATLRFDYEIDVFGRVKAEREAALAEYLATESTARTIRLALIGEVATAYFRERMLDETLYWAGRLRENQSRWHGNVKAMNKVGMGDAVSNTHVVVLGAKSDLDTLTLEQEMLRVRALLRTLVGDDPLELPPPRHVRLMTFPLIRSDLSTEALMRRSDVEAASHALTAREAGAAAARAAFFPKVSLAGLLGKVDSSVKAMLGAGGGWAIIPQTIFTLFDGGRKNAELKVAEVHREEAVARQRKVVAGARAEIEFAEAARKNLAEQVALYEDLVHRQKMHQQTVLSLTVLPPPTGKSQAEALMAERDYYAAEQALLQAQFSFIKSSIELYKALGGQY